MQRFAHRICDRTRTAMPARGTSALCLKLVLAKLQAHEPDIVDVVLDFVFSRTAQDGVTRYCGEKDMLVDVRCTSVGFRAFQASISLVSVTLPNSVTHIGKGAFCECTSLVSVML